MKKNNNGNWIKKHVEEGKRRLKINNMIKRVKPLQLHSDFRESK